jgi:Cyclic nucleotide-binding domain
MPAPTPDEKRRLFVGHAIFGKLSPSDLDGLLLHARVEHYPAGREIFAKGSPGRSMMAILSGGVRISTLSPTGREIVLTILKTGEVFGEIALIDGEDRTADATAITDCDLLVLDHRDFMPFSSAAPISASYFSSSSVSACARPTGRSRTMCSGGSTAASPRRSCASPIASRPPDPAAPRCGSRSRSLPAWSVRLAKASTSSSRFGKVPVSSGSASD